MTTLGSAAFLLCESLEYIKIPDKVTAISGRTFVGCSKLESIVISAGVEIISVDNYAINGCMSLKSIEVDENNQKYKDMDGNLYTKDGKILVQYAIGKTETMFTVPNSVIEIGVNAFQDCSLESVIFDQDSQIACIAKQAFWYSKKLEKISFGEYNQLIDIGDNAFTECSALKNLCFGRNSSLISIGRGAFSRCESLEKIIIPKSVMTMGATVFYQCSLKIYCEAKAKPNGWDSNWNYSNCPVAWGYTGG